MHYRNIVPARFVSRPNRFIAHVLIDGQPETVHVKNTGRCRELLLPGAAVYLEPGDNPNRKTRYSLVAVQKGDRLINMDSQAPNKIVEEALRDGWLPRGISGPILDMRREAVYGGSRLDFRLELPDSSLLLEVKGVTLEEDGMVLFPDAPTQRGVRHLQELCQARGEGLEACVLFLIQMEAVRCFAPNDRTHPAFGAALREAALQGVHIVACTCRVSPEAVVLDREVPVLMRAPA